MNYLRRGIWYLVTRLLAICLIAGLTITVFYYAYNVANIRVILKDGMAARAKYILGMTDESKSLDKFFLDPSDLTNERSVYSDYSIRGLDHRLNMDFLWVWPWETKASLTVTESVPRIDGRVKGSRASEVTNRNGADAIYPPEWEEVTYRVELEKKAGQWKITKLTPLSRRK